MRRATTIGLIFTGVSIFKYSIRGNAKEHSSCPFHDQFRERMKCFSHRKGLVSPTFQCGDCIVHSHRIHDFSNGFRSSGDEESIVADAVTVLFEPFGLVQKAYVMIFENSLAIPGTTNSITFSSFPTTNGKTDRAASPALSLSYTYSTRKKLHGCLDPLLLSTFVVSPTDDESENRHEVGVQYSTIQ